MPICRASSASSASRKKRRMREGGALSRGAVMRSPSADKRFVSVQCRESPRSKPKTDRPKAGARALEA
jgi:hypothetical protein